jgi:hypothetical protein
LKQLTWNRLFQQEGGANKSTSKFWFEMSENLVRENHILEIQKNLGPKAEFNPILPPLAPHTCKKSTFKDSCISQKLTKTRFGFKVQHFPLFKLRISLLIKINKFPFLKKNKNLEILFSFWVFQFPVWTKISIKLNFHFLHHNEQTNYSFGGT